MSVVRMRACKEGHFAGKVLASNAGNAKMQALPYQAIGSVDGDASFDAEYFSFLLQKLAEDPKLGLAGTAFRETSKEDYDYRFVSIEHVTGICQLFRRGCFQENRGESARSCGGRVHV